MNNLCKKIGALLLIVAMCLSFCACGNKTNDVENALQGSWVAEWSAMGKKLNRYYIFNGNTYTTGGTAVFGEIATKKGTFEIKDSTIVLTPDDGSEESSIDYTYNEKQEILLYGGQTKYNLRRKKLL